MVGILNVSSNSFGPLLLPKSIYMEYNLVATLIKMLLLFFLLKSDLPECLIKQTQYFEYLAKNNSFKISSVADNEG